ncbi:MAG: sugar phosphate isomerase/epimerase [Planctomycetaceae bacterium]|nr:sugar phosphate isomerase/epimerase [Planctomycetaceae bacterium]
MNSSRRSFLQAAAAAPILGAAFLNSQLAFAGIPESETGGVKFRLGLASYSFRKFDRANAIRMCVRARLGCICFKDFHLKMDATDEECRAAAEECKKAGLNLYACGTVYMKKPEDVVNAFRYAKAAGMNTIVCAPSPELLPLVEEKVKETGIYIAIHNHGPGDKVYPTPESVIEKVGKFDKRVGLCIDVGHTERIGASVLKSIFDYKDRIHDFHFKDITEKAQKGHGTLCGEGVLALPEYLAALKQIGYDRVVSFEWEEEADDPLPGLMQNVGYTRGLLRMMK